MPQAASKLPNIFICYRRSDSGGYARALFERLASHFGEEQIFMDLDQIEPGEDFVQVIEEAVGSCEVLLALIGRGWLTSPDEAGRRLDDPHNYVRLEIATALARRIHVIPVLVQGAQIPRPQDLPEDLLPLLRRHAYELSDQRWRHDIDQLIRTLERVFKRRREAHLVAAQEEAERQRREDEARQQAEGQRRAEESERLGRAAAEAAPQTPGAEEARRRGRESGEGGRLEHDAPGAGAPAASGESSIGDTPERPSVAAKSGAHETAGSTSSVPTPEVTGARSGRLAAAQKRVELAQTVFVVFLMFVAVAAAIALRYVTDGYKREAFVERPSEKPQAATEKVAAEQQPPQVARDADAGQRTPEPSVTPSPAKATPTPTPTPTITPTPTSITLRVRADNTANGWTDSGLMVRKGQRLRVSATGRVSLGGGRFSTPAGLPRVVDAEKLMRYEPTGTLIAVISDDNDDFIAVGASREFEAPRDGRLFLGVNEGKLDDNTGTYEVIIELLPM